METSIFSHWQQEDNHFVSTKASTEVKNKIKHQNLVIVTGHSGSGKSAIIHHIALQYKEQGWTVIPVKVVEEILKICQMEKKSQNKTLFVFDDPIGKDSLDEILYNLWHRYEKALKPYLKTVKLLMTCRKCIISDKRIKGVFNENSIIIDIENQCKFTENEKMKILRKYTSESNLSDKECAAIVKNEQYFPLLCRLYSSNWRCLNNLRFFEEPVTVLKEKVREFRNTNTKTYCALLLLIFFNNEVCVDGLLENEISREKFINALKLSGLDNNTTLQTIDNIFESLRNFVVKKIGKTYHFFHDFVMEVCTQTIGTDYPADVVKYVDISFLRKKVRLGNGNDCNDPFIIHLDIGMINELGWRLFTAISGDRMLDVVLNPCLRNKEMTFFFIKELKNHPEVLQLLLAEQEIHIEKQCHQLKISLPLFSKLEFLFSRTEVSPLCALIILGHTDLPLFCLKTLKQMRVDFSKCSLFSAVCCNGSINLFKMFVKDHKEECLTAKWNIFSPIHFASAFHNLEVLTELIQCGVDVNLRTDDEFGWAPLMLAVGNDSQENIHDSHGISIERHISTVQLLLKNKADINLRSKHDDTALSIACSKDKYNIVQILLNHNADINVCDTEGRSSLYYASQNGHEGIVQLLLCNEADMNKCSKYGFSPLYAAIKNGCSNTVQTLIKHGADINLCSKYGDTPLNIACFNGHDSIVQLLLNSEAKVNLCDKRGVKSSVHGLQKRI